MRLVVVRHGETDWNVQKKVQGVTDTHLTSKGEAQARVLAKRLAHMRVAAVYASPLQRAVRTAQILAEPHDLEVEVAPALTEVSFGAWEGRTFEEIGRADPAQMQVWMTRPQDVQIEGAERIEDARVRIDAFVNELQERHGTGTVLVVSHALATKILVASLIGLPFERMHALRLDNVSFTMFDFYPERAVLRVYNDTSHFHRSF